ncbi:DUF423 domain-containing protein [Swingsia samuiensis]|uniref:DUF423 domain-containing protein n=1 Tax=Swingsia samuiensis TaxID=1293412 RepID=A0A4Y6UJW6_9PROT|nr:DUF423 domain-containing protein [Swingsia samuiensis]QDH16295.1 DUF423 domain-containing protein [Swingsia samuiensis]
MSSLSSHETPPVLRLGFIIGALYGASGVILGALASHLPENAFAVANGRNILHTAVEMMMWHAIILCSLSLKPRLLNQTILKYTVSCFCIGITLFCFPVISFALWDLKISVFSIARVAPYGGSLLILAWLLTAFSALKKDQH